MFYVVKVETINMCNRRCTFCKFGNPLEEEFEYLPMSIVKKILQELSDISYKGRLSWFRINEPLLDKRMPEIIKLSRRKLPNVFLSLQTNGDLLDEDLANRLFDSGLNYLGISAYDQKTYDKAKKLQKIFGVKIVLKDYRDISSMKLDNRGGNIKHLPTPSSQLQKKNCLRPSSMMQIDSQGFGRVCDSDFHKNIIQKNIKDYSISEIWEDQVLQYYRITLSFKGRSTLKLCKNCTNFGYRGNPYFPLKHKDIIGKKGFHT